MRFPTLLVLLSTFSITVVQSSLAETEELGTRRQQTIEQEIKQEQFDAKPWEITEPYGSTYKTLQLRSSSSPKPHYNFRQWMILAQTHIRLALRQVSFRNEETVELVLGPTEDIGEARFVVKEGNEKLCAAVLNRLTRVGVPKPPEWYRGATLRFFATIGTDGKVKLALPADQPFYEQAAFSIILANWRPKSQPAKRPAFDLTVGSDGRIVNCKKTTSSPDSEFDKEAQEWLSRRIFPPFLDQDHNGKKTLNIHVDLEKLELSPSHSPVES